MTSPRDTSNAPSWLRRVGCVTTGRADAGIYRPLVRSLAAESTWHIVCLAGGTHHRRRFGHTVDELRDRRDVQLIPVDHWLDGDGPVEVASTAGRATAAFSHVFSQTEIDLVFVLGDRTEMLAAALAATIHKLPIAHLHGGDITEGAYDNQCRHAITKLSHVHFPALPDHARRIQQMGEEPWRVHVVGAVALDELSRFKPRPVEEVGAAVGLDLTQPTVLVAFFPETLAATPPADQIDELLAALADLDANMLLVGTNADVGHGVFDDAAWAFAAARPNAVLVPSLSQSLFWSCMAHCTALVGNSSAGILEASSFRLPVVNVGDRQTGRLHPANVIDTPINRSRIETAIHDASSIAFREGLATLCNPYGDGHAAERILAALESLPDRRTVLVKHWAET